MKLNAEKLPSSGKSLLTKKRKENHKPYNKCSLCSSEILMKASWLERAFLTVETINSRHPCAAVVNWGRGNAVKVKLKDKSADL